MGAVKKLKKAFAQAQSKAVANKKVAKEAVVEFASTRKAYRLGEVKKKELKKMEQQLGILRAKYKKAKKKAAKARESYRAAVEERHGAFRIE